MIGPIENISSRLPSGQALQIGAQVPSRVHGAQSIFDVQRSEADQISPSTQAPPLSEQTATKYVARFNQLWARYGTTVEKSGAGLPTPIGFVDWLCDLCNSRRPSTRRQYRASCLYVMARLAALPNDATAWAEAADLLAGIVFVRTLALPARTSSHKRLLITTKDYKRLTEHLALCELEYAKDLKAHLDASLVTGLRPIEWGRVRFVRRPDEWVLIVTNAKYAPNIRAHGRFRRLHIAEAAVAECAAISAYIAVVQMKLAGTQKADRTDALQKYNAAMQSTFHLVNCTIWKRRRHHCTLYSARHTVAARLKGSRIPIKEVAALLGHWSDATAGSSYAQARRGGARLPDFVLPSPSPRDVMRVRKKARAFREILAMNKGLNNDFR